MFQCLPQREIIELLPRLISNYTWQGPHPFLPKPPCWNAGHLPVLATKSGSLVEFFCSELTFYTSTALRHSWSSSQYPSLATGGQPPKFGWVWDWWPSGIALKWSLSKWPAREEAVQQYVSSQFWKCAFILCFIHCADTEEKGWGSSGTYQTADFLAWKLGRVILMDVRLQHLHGHQQQAAFCLSQQCWKRPANNLAFPSVVVSNNARLMECCYFAQISRWHPGFSPWA